MTPPNLGEWRIITGEFVKVTRDIYSVSNGHDGWTSGHRVKWERVSLSVSIRGMYIGKRTVFDGRVDEGVFEQIKTHQVWLFIINERRNPIYVLPEDAAGEQS